MRIEIEDDGVRIVSECHVPRCVRGVETRVPREALSGMQEGSNPLGRTVAKIVDRILDAAQGDTVDVDRLEEVPPVVCTRHMAEFLQLRGVLDDRDFDSIAQAVAEWGREGGADADPEEADDGE